MHQSIFLAATAPEVKGWNESVSNLIKRYKNFVRHAFKYNAMTFTYNLSLDGVRVHADARRLDINLYDSSTFSIHSHPGAGWLHNVINERHIAWVGKPYTHFDPSKNCHIGEDICVHDICYSEEEHFQLSTLYELYDYDVSLKTLEYCNDLDLNTGLIQIYPQFFHSEVQYMLDAVLHGYDK